MKKTMIATSVALLAFAMSAAVLASTPDGCQLGNGGHDPFCTPTGVVTQQPDGCIPGNGGSAPICTPGTGPGGK